MVSQIAKIVASPLSERVDLRPQPKKKKNSFLVFLDKRDVSLLLYYQTELRIKRGRQIRLCFIYTNINMSLALQKLT